METPGAFAQPKTALDEEYGRRMQEALRRYGQVASLVDREVMGWHALPPPQQDDMDRVIEALNALASTAGAGGVATEAAFVLGVLYQEGRGMAGPKGARAAECYQVAAEAGRAEALYNLACLTRTGCEGVAQDASLAFCMFEVAAAAQHANAAYNLAAMYAHGEGVESDPYKAQHFFQAAAAGGHPTAASCAAQLGRKSEAYLFFVAATTVVVGVAVTWGSVAVGSALLRRWALAPVPVPGASFLIGTVDDDIYRS